MSTTQTTVCPYTWCTNNHALTGDPTYHVKDLGFGMDLIVDDGEIRANWMPEWSEWPCTPDEIEAEFGPVRQMLADLPVTLAAFAKEVAK